LADNAISGTLPSGIGDLVKLQRLGLYRNNLSGAIPAELGNLSHLEQLVLSENNLSALSPAMVKCTKLLYLRLRKNPWEPPLPVNEDGDVKPREGESGHAYVLRCFPDEGEQQVSPFRALLQSAHCGQHAAAFEMCSITTVEDLALLSAEDMKEIAPGLGSECRNLTALLEAVRNS
jgi:hypothetical protein